MSKRYPKAKWVLPEVIDPPDRVCFQIEVPNERQHIAAFRGALLILASALSWQDDPDHTAKDVAKVWDEIYQNVRVCDVPDTNTGFLLEDDMSDNIRLDPDNNCILQIKCCGEWITLMDVSKCVAGAAGQPSGGGTVGPGDCATYDLLLQGNGRVLLPVPVQAGSKITISNAQGGWWDGNVLHAWNCPSGDVFTLGLCGSDGATDAGSPIPSQPIGRLIVEIDGTFYDAYNTTLTIPVDASPSDVYFQMNDATLSDNQGSVNFSVEVCQVRNTTLDIIAHGVYTGDITKVGIHFHLTSSYYATDNVTLIDIENADTGQNFSIFNGVYSTTFDYSSYWNGTGDPHENVGVASPLYRLVLIKNGNNPFTVDFDAQPLV